jgi:hypothetical protein
MAPRAQRDPLHAVDTPTLQALFAATTHQYARASGEAEKTALLRRAAEIVVELRSRFANKDGQPDWRGATWEYRQAVSGAYSQSGLSLAERKQVQDAMRYHISIVLREDETRLPELAEQGLLPQTSRQRSAEQKARERAVVGQARSRARTPSAALGRALRLVEGVTVGDVRALDDDGRAEFTEVAGLLTQSLARLTRAAGKKA